MPASVYWVLSVSILCVVAIMWSATKIGADFAIRCNAAGGVVVSARTTKHCVRADAFIDIRAAEKEGKP